MSDGMREIYVRIGEIKVSRDPRAVLSAYGLGSCVCVCAYDRESGVAGMAHILLPSKSKGYETSNPAMYADDAVTNLLTLMGKWGAEYRRIRVKLAGGSNVIEASNSDLMIGTRNVDEVTRILNEMKVPVVEKDLGGVSSRTVKFFVESSEMSVTSRKNEGANGRKNEAT